jgi:hypothetical protein
MDNFELEKMLEETGCGQGTKMSRFKVVGSDELELNGPLDPGQLRISNLDVSKGGGGGWHWVVFYSAPLIINRSGERFTQLYYFDSLGECPENYGNIKQFIQQYNCMSSNEGFNVQFNIPEIESSTCGIHCLYVSAKLCTGKYTLNDIMNTYNKPETLEDVNRNECKALYYVLNRFTKYSKSFEKLKGCY